MKPSEVLKEFGWTKHRLGSKEKGFDLLGAIFFLNPHKPDRKVKEIADKLSRTNLDIDTLTNSIPINGPAHLLCVWNDLQNSKEDVIEALELIGE